MTAPKSAFRKYLDETQELPRDTLLGHVVYFTINDGEYDRKVLEDQFDDLGLNTEYVPFAPKAVDAYKKATTEADETEYEMGDNSHVVLVRDVTSNPKQIVRHLVREIVDQKRRRLSHAKIGEAVFYRPDSQNGHVVRGTERFRLSFDDSTLHPGERKILSEVIEAKITAAYVRHCTFLDGMKIRGMVRDYLGYLNAIQLKPSVYFVHVNRMDELEKLQSLVHDLGYGCIMHLMPLVDLKQQREMVVEAFQIEASKALEEIVKEIAHIRSTRKKVSAEAYGKIKDDYDRVMKQATEYTRTLRITQDTTAAAAELAMDSLVDLQNKMLNGD